LISTLQEPASAIAYGSRGGPSIGAQIDPKTEGEILMASIHNN